MQTITRLLLLIALLGLSVPVVYARTEQGPTSVTCQANCAGADVIFAQPFTTVPTVTVTEFMPWAACRFGKSNVTTTGFHITCTFFGPPGHSGTGPVNWTATGD